MPIQQFVFSEPNHIDFDKHGDVGRFFGTTSVKSNHLIVETKAANGLTVSLLNHDCEFSYYVLEGDGEFVVEGSVHPCHKGDLVVIPPKVVFTYNGNLKMLLINTPQFTPDQEEELPKQDAYERKNI